MEILLVDDDLDVIEGIMDGMDWDELDFRQVHLAQSAKKAKEILESLFEDHPLVRKEEGILVFVDSLSENAVLLGGRAWVATGDYWNVKWELTEKIKLSFDEASVVIPYRQVDIHYKDYDGEKGRQ